MEKYLEIGNIRKLYVIIIENDEKKIYEGNVEDAPDDIKHLRYSKMIRDNNGILNFYVYDD